MDKKCCCLNFELEDTTLDFNLDDTSLNFGLDSTYQISENTSYRPLIEKPQIDYRVLEPGNNTYEYLGIQPTITDITEQDIDNLIYGG